MIKNEFTNSFFLFIIKPTGDDFMAKKYVATIMNRIFLGDDNYIFIPSHTVIGELDPKTQLFKDKNGQEYFSITDLRALRSEVSTGYSNLEEMSKIPRMVGRDNMQDAIADYHYYSSRFLYYVGTTEDNMVFCIPIDYVQIKNNLNKTLQEVKEHGGLEHVAETKTPIKPEKEEESPKENEDTSTIFQSDVRPEIASFFMDLLDGVYSLDDLRELREKIVLQKEDIESLLDSIDLQIEATENGESSIALRGEERVRKPREKKETPKEKKIIVPNYIDINDLFKKITKTLIAQDEPARRVLTEIARKSKAN